jgi:hypothetical protein
MNPLFQRNYNASAPILPFRIVKFNGPGVVVTATAATDSLIGVSNEVSPASGERCDIVRIGIAYVEAGAAISQGAFVTADSVGRGVAAAPAAGVNNRIIGIAEEAATAAGDVIPVLLNFGSLQG